MNYLNKKGIDKITFISCDTNTSEYDIIKLLKDTKILFIAVDLYGKVDYSVITKQAKDLGILTIAIVTIPCESNMQTLEGIESISKCVDSLFIFSDKKAIEIYGDLTECEYIEKLNEIVSAPITSMLQIFEQGQQIPIDFSCLYKFMQNSDIAVIYTSTFSAKYGYVNVINKTLLSPLLCNVDRSDAKIVLLHITYGKVEPTLDEINTVRTQIFSQFGMTEDILFGLNKDVSIGDNIRTTIIAIGFDLKKHL